MKGFMNDDFCVDTFEGFINNPDVTESIDVEGFVTWAKTCEIGDQLEIGPGFFITCINLPDYLDVK